MGQTGCLLYTESLKESCIRPPDALAVILEVVSYEGVVQVVISLEVLTVRPALRDVREECNNLNISS